MLQAYNLDLTMKHQAILLLIAAFTFPALVSAQPLVFEHLAGATGGPGSHDADSPADARFWNPGGVAVDGKGNVYVADTSNHTIRKIGPNGVVTTLAGLAENPGSSDGIGAAARFYWPSGLVCDAQGNIYVADTWNYTIRKITPDGVVTTFCGTAGPGGDIDGTGPSAHFTQTRAIAIDPSGNLWVATGLHIRKVTPDGVATTFANGSYGGIAVDSAGNVYASDTDHHVITRFTPWGFGSVIAGRIDDCSRADGTPFTSRFCRPTSLALDSNNNLYVSDTEFDLIRRIAPNGFVTTIVRRSAYDTSYPSPRGLATDPRNGALYVADADDNEIRKVIRPDGDPWLLAFAGQAILREIFDATGSHAGFVYPTRMTTDRTGNVFVADGSRVRRVSPSGVVTTVAGVQGSGPTTDPGGNLYVCSGAAILKADPAGNVSLFAGQPGDSRMVDGAAADARFVAPTALAFDSAGNLFVIDRPRIRRIAQDGTVSTFAGSVPASSSDCIRSGLATSPPPPGPHDGIGSSATFCGPFGIVFDKGDNLYVGDASWLRLITPAGDVRTLSLSIAVDSGAVWFYDLAMDPEGNLYSWASQNILKVTPSGIVATAAGRPSTPGCEDGSASDVRFNDPAGIAIDRNGRLYVAERTGAVIRAGSVAIADEAVSSSRTIARFDTVQLDTAPQTATSWRWRIIRRPAGSVAQLSSSTVRNPTFVPDVADLYRIELRAESPAGVSFSIIDLPVTPAGPLTSVAASVAGATTICNRATGGTATASATGGGSLAYQWGWSSVSGGPITNIAGATLPQYAIRASELGGSGVVFLVCTVTPQFGSAMTTNEVALTLDASLCSTLGGDANGDGLLSGPDVFHLINYIFSGGPPPIGPCDVNADGAVNAADVLYMLSYLFAGGQPPR